MAIHALENIVKVNKLNMLFGIDLSQVFMLVIGAIISIIANCCILAIQHYLNSKGELRIFYRITSRKGSGNNGWGFLRCTDHSLLFNIPITFELQNTSNNPRTIRDVSLLLYQDNHYVGEMAQVKHMKVDTEINGETQNSEYSFGTENGAYSFFIAPHSIQTQECNYMYPIHVNDCFNKVIARYYDEKNKPHYFHVRNIGFYFENKLFEPDKEWLFLNNHPIRYKLNRQKSE